MRSMLTLLAALVPLSAQAFTVNLDRLPEGGPELPNGSILSDQYRPIGILFSARTDSMAAIEPVAQDFGNPQASLFFQPDLFGAIAVFEFVEPGTSTPMDITRFELRPFFQPGESAQLVGLDEFDDEVAVDEVNDHVGTASVTMSITGVFRKVEWRTEGDPGIAASDIRFDVCAATPLLACTQAAKAALLINEKKSRREKWKLTMKGFDSETTQADFGDPVGGSTRVDVCLYDDADALLAGLNVPRAGDLCGKKQKPCWKAKGATGWTYKDTDTSSDGVKKMGAKSGSAGKGSFKLLAANKEKKLQLELPRRVSDALEGASSARVQVVASDGACFDAVLPSVKKADEELFKAKAP